MSGRDAYFSYMREFNNREGINSFYGRDKKRFLAGWHGVADKDRPDKIRKDIPEPPRMKPRPPSVPIPESLRIATEKAKDYMDNKLRIRSKLIKIANEATKITNNTEYSTLQKKLDKYRNQIRLYDDKFADETRPLVSNVLQAFNTYHRNTRKN